MIAAVISLLWLVLFGAWFTVGRSLGHTVRDHHARRALLLVAFFLSSGLAVAPASAQIDGGEIPRLPQASPDALPDTVQVRRVTLAEALSMATDASPALALARADVAEARGLARQAGARPNPTVTGEVIPLAPLGGGSFDVEASAGASLLLERPSVREARVEAATVAVRAAEARVRADSVRLATEVMSAYVSAALAGDRIAALAEVTAVVREAVRAATYRYDEGELSGFDLRRLRVEQARYEMALADAELDADLARRQLTALVLPAPDLAEGVQVVPAEELDGSPPLTTLAASLAAAARPEVFVAQAELEAALAAVEAVRLGARPSPTVSAGITRQAGGGVGPTVGVSLPLLRYDRREGDIQAAQARVEAARARLTLAERAVEADVRRAFEVYDARRQRAALLQSGLLNGADDLLQIARVAYGLDEISLVELLDATDAYREARVAVIDADAAAALAYLDLRRATGGALIDLTLTPRTP